MAAEAENAAAPGGAAVGASLYVVGIDASVTDSELHALFSQFGEVVSVEVCEDLSIGLSLRYGYVHYRNPQCAQRALEELNFTPLNGKPIRIMSFHQEPGTSKSDAETLYIKNSENKIDHKALPENFLSEDEAKFTNVFVKNLCESTTMDDLKNIFGEFGRITTAAVMTNDDGTSKCFGFVNFQNAEDAARAVESLDGQIFGNRKWYVGRAQNKHERHLRLKHDLGCVKYAFDNGCNLFVKNLDPSIDEKELKELFSEFGSVTSCRVLRDEKGNSKEKGYIAFSSAKEASDALSGMNGKDHFDKILHVVIAQRKEERRAPLQNPGKEIDHNALPEPEMFSSSEGIHSCKVATHASGHSKGYDFVQFAGEATGQEAIGKLYSIIRELTVVISKLNSDIGKLNGTVGELNGNVMKLNGLLLNRKKVNTENSLTKEIELIVDRANLTDVFVKKLSELTTDEDLRKIFDEFGLVTDAMVMRNVDGTSKCFGFVSFKNAKDAARAVESLNGQRFDKTKWFSGRAQKKLGSELEQKNSFEQPVKEAINVEEAVDKQCNLFVKNLDFSIDDEKLMELFSSFGLVTSYKIFMERKGKKSSVHGFVSFSSPEEASRALSELNGKIISGKPLHVALAQKKEDRIAQLQNSDKENGHKALPEASVSSVDKEVDKGTNQHVGKPDHNTPRGRLCEMFSPVTSLKSSKNSDKENDHKALPEASVSSVDKEVNKGTNQHVGKPDRSTPRGRLSEVFSPVTSVKPSEAMRDQNSTNRGSGFNALSPSEQDAKSLSEKNAKSFSSKHLHVAQAQRKEDRTWSQGHPRRLMHSMSVTLTHNQQRNSLSAKDFPVQKDLQPALGTKQQIIPRGHDYDCPLGGGFSVQYETGRLSLYDVVKSHSIHIGALASSLANASSLNRGGRCWMRYCSLIASRSRLNS